MDKGRATHAGWLSYELQRHLQLAKAVLQGTRVSTIRVVMDFDHIEGFSLLFGTPYGFPGKSEYTGAHDPIERQVDLEAIYAHDSPERNVAMPVVREMMEEVSQIFGLSRVPPSLWSQDGKIRYVEGLEGQR